MQRFFCYRKHRILSNPDLKFREHEAPAIRWLLDISTDQEVLLTAAQVVPDIEWPVEVDVLEIYAQVGNAFKGCFVPVPGGTGLALAPFAHDRAFVFGKALLHLFCNRLCLSKAQDEIPLGDRDFNLSLLNSFECLAKFGKDNSTSLIRAMASMLFGGNLFHQGGFSRVPQSDLTWILRLLPHLLAHPDCSIEVQRLAVSEIVELLRFPTPHQQTLADCSLSVAIMLGVPVDRKYMVRVDSSSLVDTLLEKFLQQPASVRDLAAKQQEILLLALATLLEKCQIYPKLGTCGSKACLCDTIDSVTMIFTSCVTRALQLVTAAAPATETETEAALLEHARAALHLGAILTVIPRHDDHTLNRWNPTYCGHPFRFLIDRPESVVYFLNHHYNSREDAAVADTLFMLSQSRDVEQWANSSFFIHEIIRAMNHQSEHVRHSTLQVVRRMRHALASSETAKSPILTSLRSIIPSIQGEDNKGQVLCCLQIIHTFVLYHHHDPTWVADFLQKHSDRWLRPKYTCVRAYSVYLLAILAIVEHHNIKCAFRSLFDYKLRSTHLFGAWLALEPPVAHEFNGDILDEVLPNLIAFTIKYQSYGSARSWIFDKPETLLDDLQKNRPESSSIPLLQEMISSLPPIER
ncbi:hypothetical protein BJ138DRAFT_892429 [Hygrophoropsis aurantiaca]|uniref:Uncharacterized protein n=1 Tax=Hygrophoropsis aurantiaca TaxID=72124 RepID=A0ACB8AED9_9AGAM|nr:hypothetical protein BJ138DRAFT_892429 [Hygrophoropsis aurantiaca]